MPIRLLSISPADGAITLAAEKADLWLRVMDSKIGVKRGDPLTQLSAPFEARLVLDTDSPDTKEVVLAIAEAFRISGVVAGKLAVALSEHAADDPELETPPYFDEEIDLAALETERQRPTVQLELVTAEALDARATAALEQALRAEFVEPARVFVQVMYMTNTFRFELLPLPPDQVPAPEVLRVRGFAAAGRAGVKLARLEVGAYVGDWDTTVFQQRFTAAS